MDGRKQWDKGKSIWIGRSETSLTSNQHVSAEVKLYKVWVMRLRWWICAESDTGFVGGHPQDFLVASFWFEAWGGLIRDMVARRVLGGKKFGQMTSRVMKRFGRTQLTGGEGWQYLTFCIWMYFCVITFHHLHFCVLLNGTVVIKRFWIHRGGGWQHFVFFGLQLFAPDADATAADIAAA